MVAPLLGKNNGTLQSKNALKLGKTIDKFDIDGSGVSFLT